MPQTKKIYYYVDWGAGFVEFQDFNNNLERSIERGEFNDYAFRLKLSGSVQLLSTDALSAFTYFITNGNYKVPMRLYENGTMGGGGLLKWQGWARAKLKAFIKEEIATLDSFETNDNYTHLIEFLDVKIKGESIPTTDVDIRAFEMISEGININSNKLQAYTYTAPNLVATGNSFALPTIGRVASCKLSGGIAVYDNTTRDLRRFFYTAPNWALSGLGTTLWIQNGGNGALDSYTNADILFVDDFNHELRDYRVTTGTWTLNNSRLIGTIKFPSIATMNTITPRAALVDEGTSTLRAYSSSLVLIGTPYSLGNVKKPEICRLDASNDVIALIDANTQTLRAMKYDPVAGTWSQVSDGINVGGVLSPTLTQDVTNVVIVHDAYLGIMRKYTLTGTTWAATGNTLSIGGGLYSAISRESTNLFGLIQSDTHKSTCRPARAYITLLNGLLSANGIYSGTDYVLNLGTSGATFDIEKTAIGDLKTIRGVHSQTTSVSDLEDYTIREILKLAELFQNYWYIEEDNVPLGDFQIKFKQPVNFSNVGTNYNVSQFDDVLNIPSYEDQITLDREEINFTNAQNVDFEGQPIRYNRNTNIEITDQWGYTTDWGYLVDNDIGSEFGFNSSGKFLVFGEQQTLGPAGGFVIEAGAGILGGSNVKNEKMSKARIQDDYWKDYRYIADGSFTMNGASVPVQNTVNNMIKYPDVTLGPQIVTEMPDSIGNLIFTSRTLWITAARTNLKTYQTKFECVLLDL